MANNMKNKKINDSKAHYRDLLKEVYEKKITEKEAQDFWLNVEGADYFEQIGIKTLKERLAVHSIPFKVIAKWRYEGWPNICFICKEICDMDKNEGSIVEEFYVNNKINRNIIIHWACLGAYYERFKGLTAWGIIQLIYNNLFKNHDIEVITLKEYVIGYTVKALIKNRNTKKLTFALSKTKKRKISLNQCKDSPFLPVITRALQYLEKNQDIEFKTNRTDIILFIVKQLEDANEFI